MTVHLVGAGPGDPGHEHRKPAYSGGVSVSTLSPIQVRDLGQVPFLEAWELQREIHDAVVGGHMADTLLLLEHEGVYTAGRRTQRRSRHAARKPRRTPYTTP